MKQRIIWLATEGFKIKASWYKECMQPFASWKEAVKNLYPNCKIKYYDIKIFK